MGGNESLNYNSGSLYVAASSMYSGFASECEVQGTTSKPLWCGTIDDSMLKNAVSRINGTESIKSNWDYGITLNEDAIKEIVEKITKERELAKITPDEGPEIPKWTGFLNI